MLKLSDVSKAYRQPDGQPTPILSGVNFTLAAGQSAALLGASGSGKSTLLHLIAGLDRPDAGTISIQNQSITALSESQLAHLRRATISLVFQQFYLISTLTVADNIRFQAQLAKRYNPQWKAELIERLGLTSQLQKYPHQLSGGQQQRVAIARALLHKPALVLADEPTGNLDEHSSEQVMALLSELVKQAGSSLLMVTHSKVMASYLDQQYWLKSGVLHPEEVL
ncbi:MAG: ABC transporter ATP-binding protein [Thiofilum sp.]|uniref:ABC transporter ATP-binding protein n=1 Tax=Thiofilum sp. TaxID=2212733 RepID=UPI0025CE6C32|nr:ABC transporter ATP-binding protein [Thiofilum sp.]MBK8454740.1 ABC transporter ATP-binding protein [Thiofilum sp.]